MAALSVLNAVATDGELMRLIVLIGLLQLAIVMVQEKNTATLNGKERTTLRFL